MNEKKQAEVCDLMLRISICEFEIKKIRQQLHHFCKPFIDEHKKSSVIENMTIEELIRIGKSKAAEKNIGNKIAGKFRTLIRGK